MLTARGIGNTDVDVRLVALEGGGVVAHMAHVLLGAIETQSVGERVGARALAQSSTRGAQKSAGNGRHGVKRHSGTQENSN